jgi:uncharacterized protein with PQ loop repeat
MNNNYEYIGYTGSFLISINLIPQIYHIQKIKSAEQISNLSIFLSIIACVFMITYGVFIKKIPIIISNSMIFLFYSIILYFKIWFNKMKIPQEQILDQLDESDEIIIQV